MHAKYLQARCIQLLAGFINVEYGSIPLLKQNQFFLYTQ